MLLATVEGLIDPGDYISLASLTGMMVLEETQAACGWVIGQRL